MPAPIPSRLAGKLAAMRCDPAEFRALPLEVHALLHDVPLRDVTAIDLPGGGPGRTLADVRALLPQGASGAGNPVARALFGLRWALGRLFDWDRAPTPDERAQWSYEVRLLPALRARSQVAPGTRDGSFQTMYRLDQEMLVEIRNATVHAFLASVLLPNPGGSGYRLYWAVSVKKVSWLTPLYMAAIEPFRRFIVYPSLFRGIRRAWCARYT